MVVANVLWPLVLTAVEVLGGSSRLMVEGNDDERGENTVRFPASATVHLCIAYIGGGADSQCSVAVRWQ